MTVDEERPAETAGEEPKEPGSNTGRAVLGILLVLAGLVWFAERLDLFDVRLRYVLPAAVLVVGAALVGLSFRGRQGGLIGLGVVLTILAILVALAPSGGIDGGVGDRLVEVRTMRELETEYGLGMGNLTVDLSDLDVEGRVAITVDLGMGDLNVIVPRGVAVSVTGEAGLGEVVLFGERSEGVSPSGTYETEGFAGADPAITIDASVFLGSLEVKR